LLLVAAAVGWNLVNLRALTLGVAYLDDSSVHEQMVRFATAQLRSGHLPLKGWFPYLGLGWPQFLHYQSLPATVTGLFGLVIGPDVAFRWSLYLLLSLWPISVYLAARLFAGTRPAAAASAVMSPFLVSATGIGYEQHAYVWVGFGVWTQLWASWTLPLAWGFGWRAILDGRNQLAAVVFVPLTIALHFETGYLALIPLLVWPFAAGAPLRSRLCRSALLVCGSLLASAWVIVPLISQRSWASTNEPLRGSGLVNGYGIGRVLVWLVSGRLLDHGRLPVVTAFAALGLAVACGRFAYDQNSRALLVALAVCLLLSFGRATFGVLTDLIPGGTDIFFRRFMMGVQLVALLLAGRGAAWSGRTALAALGRRRFMLPTASGPVRAVLAMAATIVVLAPGWLQLGAYDRRDSSAINSQRRADAAQGAELDRIIGLIGTTGGGRVYAGMPSNWGRDLTIGAVPVFKYLESRDVDEVGYTLRTASLMTNPEYYLEDADRSDYRLFGIKYVIVTAGYAPPVSAQLVLRSGPYWLWEISRRRLRAGGPARRRARGQPDEVRRPQHPTAPLQAGAGRGLRPRRIPRRRHPCTAAANSTGAAVHRQRDRRDRRSHRRRTDRDRPHAPARRSGTQRLLRPRLDRDRRRARSSDPDGGTRAGQHRSLGRNPHHRVQDTSDTPTTRSYSLSAPAHWRPSIY
jgi:hypothetical protein